MREATVVTPLSEFCSEVGNNIDLADLGGKGSQTDFNGATAQSHDKPVSQDLVTISKR